MLSFSNKGFTLIEIVISLGILAILAALTFTSYSNLQRQLDIDTTAQNIISVIKLARTNTTASNSESNYGVHFETGKYVLFTGNSYTAGAATNKEYSLNSSEIYATSLNGGGSEVIFDRIRGTTSQPGTVSVRLVDQTNQTAVISITAAGQVSISNNLTQNNTRIADSRHLHFDLGWSIQTATTLTLAFSDTPTVTQNIAMAGFFDAPKSEFDWSGTTDVNGTDQVLRVHTHTLNTTNTVLSVHRDIRYNTKTLTVSIDGKQIVTYTAAGVATIGAFGGVMSVQ